MRGKGFLELADVQFIERGHRGAGIGDRVAGIRVGEYRQVIAEGLAYHGDALDVAGDSVADAQFDGLVAGLHMRPRFVRKRFGILITERHAAGVGGNRLRASAEQLVQRQLERLAADIPERHVDAGKRETGAGPHAVAGKLLVVDFFPYARDVVRVLPDDQLLHRRVDEMRHGARAASMMRLAPAGYAVCRGDLDDDRVAFDRAADAERYAVLRIHRKRRPVRPYVGNA